MGALAAGALAESPSIALGDKDPAIATSDALPEAVIYYANTFDGYVTGNLIGRKTGGDTIVLSGTRQKDYDKDMWEYGLILHAGHPSDNECGAIELAKVKAAQRAGTITVKRSRGVCDGEIPKLRIRSSIGTDANCPEHACGGPTYYEKLEPGCEDELALNYDQRSGKAYNYVPLQAAKGIAHYRITSADGKKGWGMADLEIPGTVAPKLVTLWGVWPRFCFPGHPRGGPPNPNRLPDDRYAATGGLPSRENYTILDSIDKHEYAGAR